MKIKLLLIILLFGTFALNAYAQSAAPLRIKFAKGKTSAVSANTLKNGEEMDFVFGAKTGQKITLKITSVPKGDFFDFTIAGDGFEFQTDLDSYNNYSFNAPATGDYLLTVRKRPVDSLPKGKFFLTTTVK